MTSKAHKQSAPRKIPQQEAIITRHKSAQLRRQLRNKQDTITKINQMTQLLRSPSKSEQKTSGEALQKSRHSSPTAAKTRISTKPKKVVEKTHEKRQRGVSENKGSREFYPDTLKRKVEAKKVVLKPRHELKVIGKTKRNKRKPTVPQKGIKSPIPSKHPRCDQTSPTTRSSKSRSPMHSELSMEEMVRLTDESESLNDEDWLEILTCPSPVWWEDPPDARFSEDAISSEKLTAAGQEKATSEEKKPNINETKHNTNRSNEQIINDTDPSIPEAKQSDNKFMNKRSKLENLLGSLKNKLGCDKIPLLSDNLSIITANNDNLGDVNVSKTEQTNNSEKTSNKIETEEKGNADLSPNKRKGRNAFANEETRTSESTEGDDPFSNLRDDDLLNDLENVDIPIQLEEMEVCVIDDSIPSSSESPFLDTRKDICVRNPNSVENNCNEIKTGKTLDSKTIDIDTCSKNQNHESDSIASTTTPRRTPNLISSKNKIIKLKKIKRGPRKLTAHEIDTCKTHLCTDVTERKKKLKSNTGSNNLVIKDGDKTEFMTVYKIISNDASKSTIIGETSNAANTLQLTDDLTTENKEQNTITLDSVKNRLDSFYRKFKNTYQRRSRKQEIKMINNNSVSLNEVNVETKIDNDVTKANEDQAKDHLNNEKENSESTVCDSCDPIKAKHDPACADAQSGKKTIVVSNKNRVNYCLKCSCIFNTETCAYCVRKRKWDVAAVPDDTSSCDKESSCKAIVEENKEES